MASPPANEEEEWVTSSVYKRLQFDPWKIEVEISNMTN